MNKVSNSQSLNASVQSAGSHSSQELPVRTDDKDQQRIMDESLHAHGEQRCNSGPLPNADPNQQNLADQIVEEDDAMNNIMRARP